MTKRSTKNALLSSVVALLLCCSMLVGTTFAWFTDSVTSANNVIVSGNLDVTLEYWNGTEWKDVEGSSEILDKAALWEPGYTEVVYLKLENKGSLALKYQLGVNIASETQGVNQAGEGFKLSDYIYMDVVEKTAFEKLADRAAADALKTEATLISEGFAKKASLVAGADPVYLTLVVYMPESVGNAANHNGTDVPAINLGINVFATQETSEKDAFDDQYDANAPFSMWDGTVPAEMPASLVVDGATQTVYVKDAAAFAYLSTLSDKWAELYTDGNGREYSNYANGAGANYYYSGQWTVELEADIDLNNHPIEPILLVLGESTGASAFQGNGHVIRNINTTTGLFKDGNRVSYSDLTLVNVKATNGALTGSSNTNISNVTVENATISGVDYVGGLVGYIYGDVINCKVLNSSVIGSGKEVGGLIGYIASSTGENKVSGNKVNGVDVYANNRAAGLVAQANVGVKVYGNTVDTVTVGAEDTTTYAPNAIVSNALDATNVYDNRVVNANVLGALALVESATELATAVSAGGTVVLTQDVALNDTVNVTTPTEIELGGKNLTVKRLEAKDKLTVTGGTVVHEKSNYPALSVSNGGSLTMEEVTVVSENYCNLMTSGGQQAAEFVGIQVFDGDCVLNDCDILVEIKDLRLANSAIGVGIHGGSLTMNGGSITVISAGSTNPSYDSQSAIFAGSNTEKTVTLIDVEINAKEFLCASRGNITVNTTDADGTWDGKCSAINGTYTIHYDYDPN